MGTDRKAVSFSEDVVSLVDLLQREGVSLRDSAVDRLASLSCTIEHWNKAVNLVSRQDIGRLVSYHFCDSASLLPIMRPAREIDVLDVGGSNGLPGLVLASLSPYVRVLICDSRKKRQTFLEQACKDFGGVVSFKVARVDGKAFQDEYAAMFDLIVARAVTKLRHLLRWCMPLLKPGGCLAAYKGSRCLEEVRQAESYIWAHGGVLVTILRSPWADRCNSMRLFAIVKTMGQWCEQEVGMWERS